MSDQLSEQVEDLARARGLDISPDVVAEAVKRVLAALGDSPAPSGNRRNGLSAERATHWPPSDPTWCSRQAVSPSTRSRSIRWSPARSSSRTSRPALETLEYQAQIAESAGRPNLATTFGERPR